MITFTTYHFSPYGIYVDLNNLSFGVADSTPKTGDGIHPKWFLVIGLVALSLIMFIRKDNLPQAKTA
jgi:LPXTG-motif cell wall-anchored protein